MKRIEVTIDPAELDEVRETLAEAGALGMTVLEVRGFDRRRTSRRVYFGSAYAEDSALKLKITVVVVDDCAPAILEALERSGRPVSATQIVEAVRIRTDERGDDALA
jgi:nitrogen regulatory protein P-II 1